MLAKFLFFILMIQSCKDSKIVGSAVTQITSNQKTKEISRPTSTPTPTPTPMSGGGGGGAGAIATSCSDPAQFNLYCHGGYGASKNKKSIPTYVWFLNPAGTTLTSTPQQDADYIISKANERLVVNGHTHLKFDPPKISTGTAPSLNTIANDSNFMISSYGSSSYYVLILVQGLVNGTPNRVIGYSTGLRIDYKSKQSIVVMDYDYVMKNPKGGMVIIHELFHGLGAPHTTDGNGGYDNIMQSGLMSYKDIKITTSLSSSNSWTSALTNSSMAYSFPIYIEDRPKFEGVVSVNGTNWDTATLMMQYATTNPFFTSGDSGYNAAYSRILDIYYDSFLKD
jgi:hypothetical protein